MYSGIYLFIALLELVLYIECDFIISAKLQVLKRIMTYLRGLSWLNFFFAFAMA